mgnify:CR=1 FL=1
MDILYKRQALCLASFFILISLFIFLFTGCSRTSVKAPVIDAEFAYSMAVKLASHGSRPSGSAALLKQAEFIKSKVVEFGAKSDIIAFSDNTPDGLVKFYNVEARIAGKIDEFIVIGCHYDTKKLLSTPDFSGANDGASGVALLLAMIFLGMPRCGTSLTSTMYHRLIIKVLLAFHSSNECNFNQT